MRARHGARLTAPTADLAAFYAYLAVGGGELPGRRLRVREKGGGIVLFLYFVR